jgi:hypothetical protein
MNAAFDTLKFARALREKAKLTSEQAEGFADAISEAVQNDLSTKADVQTVRSDLREVELALKADLRGTELALKADMRESELRLDARIEASKAEIIKWMFGTIGFQTLIILGAVIALARILQP